MNYKYYNTSSATEIRINAQRMIRSGSWYEQEVINFWFNVDNIFMAYQKKKPFFLVLLQFKIFRILSNNVSLILILGQSKQTHFSPNET